jgi:hypothetical protein
MNPQELTKRLAKEVDMSQFPEVLREERMQKLVYTTMRTLVQEIMKKIPENRLEEFAMVNEAGDPTKTQAFLSKFIHNLEAFTDDIIKNEVKHFKEINNLS